MNWLEIHFPWAVLPVLLCVVMVACLWAVWGVRRSHRYLLWQSVGMLLLALAFANVVPTVMLWGSAWMAAQAISLRFGQTVQWKMAAVGSVLMLALGSIALGTDWGEPLRLWGIAVALALVLGHVMPQVWRGAARHSADQWLRYSYGVCVLYVLLFPVIADPLVRAAGGGALALLLSVNFATCAWDDRTGKPRTAHYRDVSTHLLNRAGLAAVNAVSLTERGITVVMLCEFKAVTAAAKVSATRTAAQQAFAQLLQSSVRAGDWVARTASEEYVMALRGMDRSQSLALVERIREALVGTSIMEGHSVSFGIAQVQAMDTLEKAIHRADVALYQAKEDGSHSMFLASAF